MKHLLWCAAVTALVLSVSAVGPARTARGADPKPLVVVSVSGYDELLGDIELVGRLTGNPDAVKWVQRTIATVTSDQGLAGLDQTRPWGAVVQIDPEVAGQSGTAEPLKLLPGYGVLPITDLPAFLGALENVVGRPEQPQEGVFRLGGPRNALYLKQAGQWTFVAPSIESLSNLPEKPDVLFADLAEEFDLAVRVHAVNLPDTLRETLVAELKKGAARDTQQRPGEEDDEFALRQRLSDHVLRSIITLVNETDQVTLGWALDHHAQKTFGELRVTARKGTQTARDMAGLAKLQSAFGGFVVPGAALTARWTHQAASGDADQAVAVIDALRKRVIEGIERDVPEKDVADAKRLAGQFIDAVRATASGGRMDGAAALILDSQVATFLTGAHVVEATKVEGVFRELAEKFRREQPLIGSWLKLDADTYRDVRFHTLTIPIPEESKAPEKAEEREKIVQKIGPSAEMVVGFGKESVYFAAGRDAMKTLKQAIENSEATGVQTVAPLRVSVAVKPIAQFLAEVGKQRDQAKAADAVAVLESVAGNDHINLVIRPIEQGVAIRLEAEEGVLKLVGKMVAKR